MIDLDQEEAQEILDTINPEGLTDPMTKLSALVGIIAVVRTMQDMGYRIARPLKEIKLRTPSGT